MQGQTLVELSGVSVGDSEHVHARERIAMVGPPPVLAKLARLFVERQRFVEPGKCAISMGQRCHGIQCVCIVRSQGELAELQILLQKWQGLVWLAGVLICLLYTSPSPRDRQKSRMPS